MLPTNRLWFMTPLLALWAVAPVAAQASDRAHPAAGQAQAADYQVNVSVRPESAAPKSTLSTAVYLSTAPDVRLKTLAFQLSYPRAAFSFSRVEKGALIRSPGFHVEATPATHATDSQLESVKVRITVDEQEGETALPAGLILYIGFAVPATAKPGLVNVQNEIIEAEAIGTTQLSKERLVAENQTITIVTPDMVPILACFFYMH